jgi:hypothetical protein
VSSSTAIVRGTHLFSESWVTGEVPSDTGRVEEETKAGESSRTRGSQSDIVVVSAKDGGPGQRHGSVSWHPQPHALFVDL